MSEKTDTISEDHPPHGGLLPQPIGLAPKLRRALVDRAMELEVDLGYTFRQLMEVFDCIVAEHKPADACPEPTGLYEVDGATGATRPLVGTVRAIFPPLARVFAGEREIRVGDDINPGENITFTFESDGTPVTPYLTIDRKVP